MLRIIFAIQTPKFCSTWRIAYIVVRFLVVCTRLYKPHRRSFVRWSVGQSVLRSVAVSSEHATFGDRPCCIFNVFRRNQRRCAKTLMALTATFVNLRSGYAQSQGVLCHVVGGFGGFKGSRGSLCVDIRSCLSTLIQISLMSLIHPIMIWLCYQVIR